MSVDIGCGVANATKLAIECLKKKEKADFFRVKPIFQLAELNILQNCNKKSSDDNKKYQGE